MRLTFVLDGFTRQVGVAVRQDSGGVHLTIDGSDDVVAVKQQVARMLSLDHDGRPFEAVGRRDPVIGRLQAVAPGLRPPLCPLTLRRRRVVSAQCPPPGAADGGGAPRAVAGPRSDLPGRR